MPVSPPPPVPLVEATIDLGGGPVRLVTRALTALVVAPPRWGRESEVLAAVAAAHAAGADLADVSLDPRLIGPAVRAAGRSGGLPVSARVDSLESARRAQAAGAALLLVDAPLIGPVAENGWPAAVIVDDVADIAVAGPAALRHGVPLAIDSSRRAGADALAEESVAVASGCRIVRTADARRTRRVIEVVAALLEARHGG